MTAEERIQGALAAITQMSGFDGGHHKQYCIDQVTRALCGGKVIKASRGYEYRKTAEYRQFVRDWENGEDGPSTYEWDEGIAP